MVNFLKKKKEKKSTEPISKAGGKIVLMSFDGLNPADFPYTDDLTKENIKERFLLLSFDGRYYLNSNTEGCEGIAAILEILVRESQYRLERWRKERKKKYSDLTFDNIAEIQDKDEVSYAFAYLLIPTEITRRKVERQYYSQK